MFENRVRWQIETTNEQFFIWNPGIYFVNDNINHRLTPIYTYYTVPVCIRTLQSKEGCQQSFLSLLRERALCALYLYRSLDIKVTSLHNWVESVTNPEQDIVIKMNTEGIQKLKTSGMKYTLIQVLRGNRAFNRL